MKPQKPLPPGESTLDPSHKDIDAVAFALDRVRTMLVWIEEHRASFEVARVTDPKTAEKELDYLRDATQQARKHMSRLMDLVLAGYAIDPSKQLPQGLQRNR